MQLLSALPSQSGDVPVWNGNATGSPTIDFLALLLSGVEPIEDPSDLSGNGSAAAGLDANAGRTGGRSFLSKGRLEADSAKKRSADETLQGLPIAIDPRFLQQQPVPALAAFGMTPDLGTSDGADPVQALPASNDEADRVGEEGRQQTGQPAADAAAATFAQLAVMGPFAGADSQRSQEAKRTPDAGIENASLPPGLEADTAAPQIAPAAPQTAGASPEVAFTMRLSYADRSEDSATPASAAVDTRVSSGDQAVLPPPTNASQTGEDAQPRRNSAIGRGPAVRTPASLPDAAITARRASEIVSGGGATAVSHGVTEPDTSGIRSEGDVVTAPARLAAKLRQDTSGVPPAGSGSPDAQQPVSQSQDSGGKNEEGSTSQEPAIRGAERKSRFRPEDKDDSTSDPVAGSPDSGRASADRPGLAGGASGTNPQAARSSRNDAPAPVASTTPDAPAEAPKSPPLREISLKLPGKDDSGVDLHIVDQRGKLHVEVRTADTHLASSLRDNVGDLVGKLESSGYRTEEVGARKDAAAVSAPDSSSQMSGDNGGRQSGTEQDAMAGQGGHSGQQQQQGQGRGNRPRWLEEIVKNFDSTVQEKENKN